MTLTQLKPLTLGEYTFPDWTLPVGQLMTASITFGVLGWIIYCLIDCFKNGKVVFKQKNSISYQYFKSFQNLAIIKLSRARL